MITRPIWKCPYIKLFITYFRHLEKRHPYWPETKSRPILTWANMGLDMEMITWAFPYSPGYHPSPLLAPDCVSGLYEGLGMITRPIWKCPYIKLFITYFRHLEKRHPYWPETVKYVLQCIICIITYLVQIKAFVYDQYDQK
jgi:hypothetical protein